MIHDPRLHCCTGWEYVGVGNLGNRDWEVDDSEAVWIKGKAEQHDVGSTDVPVPVSIETAAGNRNAS